MDKFEKFGNVIWKDNTFCKPEDSNTSTMSHALHYASAWFEGIRTYKTHKGTAILLLDEHIRRMLQSPLLHGWDFSPYFSYETLREATIETVRRNGVGDGYIRPLLYLGLGWDSLMPSENIEYHAQISTWGLTQLFTGEGIKCALATRPRISNSMLPMESKCAANYTNSMFLKLEAKARGFSEALALDANGNISETSSSNIFLVKDNVVYTPSLECSVLNGLTRQTTIKIARELLGLEVVEGKFSQDLIFAANELFITGSAAGIVSISQVEEQTYQVSSDSITSQIAEIYNAITADNHPWSKHYLTYV